MDKPNELVDCALDFAEALDFTEDEANTEVVVPHISKIRCIDCEYIIRRQFCGAQDGIKVKRKKLHNCEMFEKRLDKSPTPDRYVPANAKEQSRKARRFIRKLIEAGAQVNADGTVTFEDLKIEKDGAVFQRTKVEVPKTTATAGILGAESLTTPLEEANKDNDQ